MKKLRCIKYHSSTLASTRTLCIVRLWSQIYTRSCCCRSQVSWTRLVQRQLLCNFCEQFANVFCCLCGRLEEEQTCFACVLLSVGGRDGTFVRIFFDQIEFVSGESDDDIFISLTLK